MNEQDAKVFKAIAGTLAESIPGWLGTGTRFDAAQTPEVRAFAHSFIARFTLEQNQQPAHLLVKIPHRPNRLGLQAALADESLRQPARDVYEDLRATWQTFERLNNPDYTAIRPLGFLEAWHAVVMLEVEGLPLRSLLVKPQFGFSQPAATEQFTGYLRQAGRWLRHYHEEIGGLRVGPVSKDLMAARLDKVAGDAAAYLGGRTRPRESLSTLRKRIGEASGPEPVARLHGDFHASNILVTPQGQVCVLDPRSDPGPRSVYDDLATLLIDLYLKPIPILTGGVFTRKFLEQSRRAVVESYFEPGEFQPALLDFYCACEAIFKWSMDERDFTRRKKMRMVAPLARPFLTSYMHGLIRRYL